MIRQGHVGNYGFPFMIAITTSLRMFLSLPEVMAKVGQSAGWMVPLVGLLVTLPAYYIYYLLLERFPGKSIALVNEEVWGPWIGLLIMIMVWGVYMAGTALSIRQFAETFITVALPHTPISVLLIVGIAVLSYASYLGIEPITRTAFLMGPWIFLAVLFILVGVLPSAEPRHLLPLWGPGIPRLLLNGAKRSALYFDLLAAGVFAPSFRQPKDLLITGVIGASAAGVIMSMATAVTIMTASVDEAKAVPDPLYFIARQIYFGRFFQRVEAPFILVWFFAMIVGLTFIFHGSILSLADGLHLPFYQPLVLPSAVILFVMALCPRNFVQAQQLNSFGLREYGWILYILVLITYLLALIRGKGKPSSHAKLQKKTMDGKEAGGSSS